MRSSSILKQTIRKDLLEGGNGESHGGLQEGGVEDGTNRQQFVHVERNYQMLMKRILSRENLIVALKRVERNKGSHGIDGMSVKFLRRHLYDNWLSIRDSLMKGTYEPLPVRR